MIQKSYIYNSFYRENAENFIKFVIENKNYGDIIDLTDCAKILKFNIYDNIEYHRFKNLMSQIKNILIDNGILLKYVRNKGYYIMKPKQIPNYVFRTYTLKTLRLMEKQDRILKNTKTRDLNEIRLKENKEIKILTNTIYTSIKKDINQSDYFSNKDVYDTLKD